MTHQADDQIEHDIAAFVSGQLDTEQRFAVADYLAAHPGRAAEVMAQVQLTEGLKLTFSGVSAPTPQAMLTTADRLSRGLAQRRFLRRIVPFALAACMFGLGWSAQAYLQTAPAAPIDPGTQALVDAALDAQDAVVLRMSLTGELGPLPLEARQISARLGIDLPLFPADWRIMAAQVVATPERPGVVLVIDTPDLGEIMLFSVLRTVDSPDKPSDSLTSKGRSLAFFEKGRAAYVLVDNSGPVADLTRGAEDLRHRFN
ncbi:MAG: hypothetical protein ABI832_11335 [bacterium]